MSTPPDQLNSLTARQQKLVDDAIALHRANPTPKVSGNGSILNVVKDLPQLVVSGGQQLVSDAGALVEGAGAFVQNPDIEAAGRDFRVSQQAKIDARTQTLTPEGQRVTNAGILDAGIFGGDVPTGQFLLGKTASLLPGTLGAGAIGKGIQVATKGAIGLGVGSAAGEAAISASSGAAAQARNIDATSTDQLLKDSSQFRAAYEKYSNLSPEGQDAAARSELKAMAIPTGALASSLAVAAGSALAGRFVKGTAGGVFDDTSEAAQGIIQGTLAGARRESIQEVAQSTLESIAGDTVTGAFVDPTAAHLDNLIKNAATGALEGAVLGGTVGGVIGAVQGKLNKNAGETQVKEQKQAAEAQKQAETVQKQSGAQQEKEAAAAAKTTSTTVDSVVKSILDIPTGKTANSIDAKAKSVRTTLNSLAETSPEVLDLISDKLGVAKNISLESKVASLNLMVDAQTGVGINEEVAKERAAADKIKQETVPDATETPAATQARVSETELKDLAIRLRKSDRSEIIKAASDPDPIARSLALSELAEKYGSKGQATSRLTAVLALKEKADALIQQQNPAVNKVAEEQPATEQASDQAAEDQVIDEKQLSAEEEKVIAKFAADQEALDAQEAAAKEAADQSVEQAKTVEVKDAEADATKSAADVDVDAAVDAILQKIDSKSDADVDVDADVDAILQKIDSKSEQPLLGSIKEDIDAAIGEAKIAGSKQTTARLLEVLARPEAKEGLLNVPKSRLIGIAKRVGVKTSANQTTETIANNLVATSTSKKTLENTVDKAFGSIFSENSPARKRVESKVSNAPEKSVNRENNLSTSEKILDKTPPSSQEQESSLNDRLASSESREIAANLLSTEAKTKQNLVKIAKSLDIPSPAKLTKQKLSDAILDATVGARLKSESIRGGTEPTKQQKKLRDLKEKEAASEAKVKRKKVTSDKVTNSAKSLAKQEKPKPVEIPIREENKTITDPVPRVSAPVTFDGITITPERILRATTEAAKGNKIADESVFGDELEEIASALGVAPEGYRTVQLLKEALVKTLVTGKVPASKDKRLKRANAKQVLATNKIDGMLKSSAPAHVSVLQNLANRWPSVAQRYMTVESRKSVPDITNIIRNIQFEVGKVDLVPEETAEEVKKEYFSMTDAAASEVEVENLADMNAADPLHKASVGGDVGPGMSTSAVRDALKHLNISRLSVVSKISDLPKSAVEAFPEGTKLRGMYVQSTDTVYVVAEEVHTAQEAALVAMHETVHRGLTKTFGREVFSAMKAVYQNNTIVREAADVLLAKRPELQSKWIATEEILGDMARDGSARSLTFFDKIVSAINNWLVKKGIIIPRFSDRQVEMLVAGAQRAGSEPDTSSMGTDGEQYANMVSDVRASVDPNNGPGHTFDRVDGVLNTLKNFVESSSPAVTGWLHNQKLNLSTGFHISEYYGRILGKKMGEKTKAAIERIEGANGRSSAIVNKLNKDTSILEKRMAALSEKQQSTLHLLMGESTRLGMFPNKPFESQTWLTEGQVVADINKNIRPKYDHLVKLYNTPGIKDLYDDLVAHNERDFNLSYASLLSSITFSYQAPSNIWRALDPNMALSSDPAIRASFDQAVAIAELWMGSQGGLDAANALTAMKDFRSAKLQGPYFHLGRYGDFFARFKVANNPEAIEAVRAAFKATGQSEATFISEDAESMFLRFESEAQWINNRKILEQLQQQNHLESLTTGKLEQNMKDLDSQSLTFMQNLLGRIDSDIRTLDDPEQRELTKETVRRLLVEMMPEVTGSKQLARRKDRPGYDLDMRRSFVKRSAAAAFMIAHNTTRPEVMIGFKEFRNELNDSQLRNADDPDITVMGTNVFNHLKKRMDNNMKPIHVPTIDSLSALGYTMFLASNPPHIIANMAQPIQTTLPLLAGRHGFAKTTGVMFRALKASSAILKNSIGEAKADRGLVGILDAHIAIDNADLSPGQKKAMSAYIDSGRLEFTQQHGLGRIALGQNETLSTVTKTVGALSHFSESINRMVSGLSAYDLEFERQKKLGKSDAEAQSIATSYGLTMIAKSQFLYDTENRAYAFSKRGFLGALTPLATGFQQFNMQFLELLSDLTQQATSGTIEESLEAKRALKGILATTTVLAGLMGLPFVTVIAAIYDRLGDDDDPNDLRSDLARFLSDMMGADAAKTLMHGGIDAATGATLSTRVSLADIIPFSKFFEDRRELSDKMDAGALGFMGPSVGAGVNIVLGASKIVDGDVMKGMVMMLPAFLQGPLKGTDLAFNGFTTGKGDKLPINASSWDVFVQLANFNPAIKSELQRNVSSQFVRDRLLQKRKSELTKDFVKALESGDTEAQQRVGKSITEFFIENPERGEFDIEASITGKEKKLSVARLTETGVQAPETRALRIIQDLQGITSTNLRERLRNAL